METKSYIRFWQRIHKAARKKGFPLRVMFELTYRCNFKCKHCYVPESYKKNSKQELKTKEVFSILDQLMDLGCFYLGFTGGEPFLREDIFEILWYAKRKGFQIIIYTNGSLIDDNKASKLKQLSPNKVDITIPAFSKNVFESISGITGSQDKVFRTINILFKKGINLGFKTCLLKANENGIKDIQDFAASLGALHRLDNMLLPRLDGDKEPYRYRGRLHISQKSEVRSQKSGLLKQHFASQACNIDSPLPTPNSQLQTPNSKLLFKCGVGLSQAAINPFGELKMCLMIDYPKYKILDTSLKDSWQRLKKLVDNIKPDENYKCSECGLKAFCKWCPGRAWLYNKTFTSCEPESRNWTEQRKRDYEEIAKKAILNADFRRSAIEGRRLFIR